MQQRKWMFSAVSAIVLGLLNAPAGLGADKKAKSVEGADQIQLVLDVAMDGRTMNYGRADAWQTGAVRGDTFVMNGKIFSGGAIPAGDTTNVLSPDDDGSIGTLICRGLFVVNGADIINGATRSIATSQQFYLDEGHGLMTEGLEGIASVVRAVTGGTGQYSGSVGQVVEEVLGFNATGGFNLRFTFNMVLLNPQDAVTLQARAKTR